MGDSELELWFSAEQGQGDEAKAGDGELSEFEADVEAEEGGPDVGSVEAFFDETSGEAEAVNESEAEGDVDGLTP